MKKRFVIACDGTWNRLDAPHPTNVAKLVQAVLPRDDKGVPQIVLHLDGVGAGRGTGAVAQRIDRVLGGAFGWGLNERIIEAYTFLMLNYAPGDQIFIFGYSRGAYTARSLAGMIRNCGILERRHAGKVGEAMALYRLDDITNTKPDDEASRKFRADFSAHVTTGKNEAAWRREHGYPAPAAPPVELGAQFIGVWDTVGALGIPEGLTLSGVLNEDYKFHDTKLSSTVKAARHAIAIDERRSTFPAAPWKNLAEFAGSGVHLEQWFPGDHGSVGGGGEEAGLSDGALVWVLEGAQAQGLALDAGMLDAWRRGADFRAPWSAVGRRTLAGIFTGFGRPVDRTGPGAVAGVSAPARERWRALGYRPKPLTPLAAELDRKPAEAEAA